MAAGPTADPLRAGECDRYMYMIVGLGNPGKRYEKTRHNMGFAALDRVAEKIGVSVSRSRFNALVGEGRIGDEKVVLLKPMTYMNLSGSAVSEAVSYYKIPSENLILIYDDVDIEPGAIRIRKSGGPGTHNGMKSVVSSIGTKDFPRVRIGIGQDREMLLTDYVIKKVPKAERVVLDEAAVCAADAAIDIVKSGIDMAMNIHNPGKKTDSDED